VAPRKRGLAPISAHRVARESPAGSFQRPPGRLAVRATAAKNSPRGINFPSGAFFPPFMRSSPIPPAALSRKCFVFCAAVVENWHPVWCAKCKVQCSPHGRTKSTWRIRHGKESVEEGQETDRREDAAQLGLSFTATSGCFKGHPSAGWP